MRKKIKSLRLIGKVFFITYLLSVVVVRFLAAQNESASSTVALPAAYEFSLDTIDGKKIDLSALKGKVVFLDFWASWCPPCRASLPAVKKLYEKYASSNDVVIIGINMENLDVARRHATQSGVKYISAVGNDITVRRYGVRGIPTFVLINKKGEIMKKWVGFADTLYDEWVQNVEEARLYQPEKEKVSPAVKKKPSKKSSTTKTTK